MKCSNCYRPALYTENDPRYSRADYCHICLPLNLKSQADRGQLPLLDADGNPIPYSPVVAPVAVVEEPVVEEVEVPKPKKKAAPVIDPTPADVLPEETSADPAL